MVSFFEKHMAVSNFAEFENEKIALFLCFTKYLNCACASHLSLSIKLSAVVKEGRFPTLKSLHCRNDS